EMLRPQGARAVDFEGRDLNTIADMVAIGRWYGSRMGLHVSVRRGGEWQEVVDVPDAGPIAWRDVAARFRHPVPQRFAPSTLVAANTPADADALRSIAETDTRYLETTPGQQFTIRFGTGVAPRDSVRTFLLA